MTFGGPVGGQVFLRTRARVGAATGFADGEMEALLVVSETRGRPSDPEAIAHYQPRIGDECVARAQARAEEIVARYAATGAHNAAARAINSLTRDYTDALGQPLPGFEPVRLEDLDGDEFAQAHRERVLLELEYDPDATRRALGARADATLERLRSQVYCCRGSERNRRGQRVHRDDPAVAAAREFYCYGAEGLSSDGAEIPRSLSGGAPARARIQCPRALGASDDLAAYLAQRSLIARLAPSQTTRP